jgi:two-component system LytT family response regulator
MNCMIVDDEELSSSILKLHVEQISYLKLIGICKCPFKALDSLNAEKVDLLFLDIEMPGLNGLDLIKSLDKPPLVILTTTHTGYALEAYENNVVDYLVKPIEFPKLLKSTEKAKRFQGQIHKKNDFNSEYLFLKKDSMLHKVAVKDIQWVEASGDYVTVCTSDSSYSLHLTLKAIEKKLPAERFIRTHRSFMIQLEQIGRIDDNVICIGKKLIPIGSLYKDEFMRRLNLL